MARARGGTAPWVQGLEHSAGLVAATAAACTWAVASILFARVGRALSAPALNLAKCAIGGGLLALTLLAFEGQVWPDVNRTELMWLGASAIVGLTVGDTAFFESLNRLGPRRALLFWALAPPLTAVLAWVGLGEPLSARMLLGISVTMAGVTWVVVERSPESEQQPGLLLSGCLFGAIAALGQALGAVFLKQGATELGALEVSVVRLAVGTAGIAAHLLSAGRTRELRRLAEPRLGAETLAGTLIGTYLGIWLSVFALQNAFAGIAATLMSTSPLFVLPLAVWLLKERVSPRAIMGACVAVGGLGLLLL